MKKYKIRSIFNYTVTKYDWSFHFLPYLVIWKTKYPSNNTYEFSVGFMFWEFSVMWRTKKKD